MADFPPMTDKAAEAFSDYVGLGPRRSLETLAAAYKLCTEPVPTKHIQTLKTWSSKFQWQARIAEASTAEAERKLRLSAELDADTFFKTSQKLNRSVEDASDTRDIVAIRETVRKPTAKTTATFDVTHSGTIKHAHHDMSGFTDDEIDTLAEIAKRQKAEVAQ